MQKILHQEEQMQDVNKMAGWGKRKDGQAYPKRKASGTKTRGTTQSSGTKLKSNAKKIKNLKNETIYVSMTDDEGFEYEEPITLGDLAAFHYDRRVDERNSTFSSQLTIGNVSAFGQSGRIVVDVAHHVEDKFSEKYGKGGYQKIMNQLVNELDEGTKVNLNVVDKAITAKQKEEELKKNYKSKNGFKDTKFMTSFEKDKVLDDWEKFLKSEFDPQFFTDELYQHLTLHAGFIAHFNRGGFYNNYFQNAENTLRFLKMFDADGEMKSAEYGDDFWLSDNTAGDLNKGMIIAFTPLKKKIYLTLNNESLSEDQQELAELQKKVEEKKERFKKKYG